MNSRNHIMFGTVGSWFTDGYSARALSLRPARRHRRRRRYRRDLFACPPRSAGGHEGAVLRPFCGGVLRPSPGASRPSGRLAEPADASSRAPRDVLASPARRARAEAGARRRMLRRHGTADGGAEGAGSGTCASALDVLVPALAEPKAKPGAFGSPLAPLADLRDAYLRPGLSAFWWSSLMLAHVPPACRSPACSMTYLLCTWPLTPMECSLVGELETARGAISTSGRSSSTLPTEPRSRAGPSDDTVDLPCSGPEDLRRLLARR